MPFFSVVIPTYNCANNLKQTIQSVLDQTFSAFEVLVMDDGSTDNTEAVVEAFQDTRIHYAWAENSGGPATPRNRGIEVARGEWVCFLDADDLWNHDKLEKVAGVIAENDDVDVVSHSVNVLMVDTGQRSNLKGGPYEKDFYKLILTQGNRIITSATTVRRSFLVQHKLRLNQAPDYVIVEDYDFWLRIAFHGARFHFIKEFLGEYRVGGGSISLNTSKMWRNQMRVLHDHVYQIQCFEKDKDKLWRQIKVRLLVQDFIIIASQRHYCSALKVLFSAFRQSPGMVMRYFLSWMRRKVRNVRLLGQ